MIVANSNNIAKMLKVVENTSKKEVLLNYDNDKIGYSRYHEFMLLSIKINYSSILGFPALLVVLMKILINKLYNLRRFIIWRCF